MRTITLKSHGLGRYDDVSPFIIANRAMTLKFKLPNQNGEFFLVTELNGRVDGETQIPREGTVTLTGLEAGELHAVVKHYLHGEIIECYKVEPLLLKAVDRELSAMPEISLLFDQDEALKKSLTDLAEAAERRFATHETRLEAIEKSAHRSDVAFLAFAYAEYLGDVQLNAKSLPPEEFLGTLGYSVEEFTTEEIEEIKTLKEKL